MDILFLLVPLSVVLALAIVGLLAWAVWSGQFEDIESEGQRIMLDGKDVNLDVNVNANASELPR